MRRSSRVSNRARQTITQLVSMLPVLISLAFIVLKLIGAIDWAWWLVLAPLWIVAALYTIALLFVLLVIFIMRRGG